MKLTYTGERVVPGKMSNDVTNWQLHLLRYVFSLDKLINKIVLDVACGSGYGSALISSVAKEVKGIDIDKKTIDWARINNFFYCPTSFVCLDAESIQDKCLYDSVVCFEGIEHFDKPEMVLKNIYNSLRDEGYFIFSIPINDPPNPFHTRIFDWESAERIITENFSRYITWYSQTLGGIVKGKKQKTLFAIGIARKNLPSIKKRFKADIKLKGSIIKKNISEKLGLTPRSRW